jgi:adenosylcobyric acid synthase
VIGVIVNKFRGDRALFEGGVRFLQERTGLPVLGVVPMLQDLVIDQEDGVAEERGRQKPFDPAHVNIAVVLLRRMSNFTDFKHVAAEQDVRLRYVDRPQDLAGADVVIIPGSKNTLEDLRAIREAGYPEVMRRHVEAGGELIGICGGFQMLGRRLSDPDGVESGGADDGLGLLDVSTVLMPVKTTSLVEAEALHIQEGGKRPLRGYYIHMGATHRGKDRPCFRVVELCDASDSIGHSATISLDGAISHDGLVWGTYIHGMFEQSEFRRDWLNRIRSRKGWEALNLETSESVSVRLDGELDRWADHVSAHLSVAPLFIWIGRDGPAADSPVR